MKKISVIFLFVFVCFFQNTSAQITSPVDTTGYTSRLIQLFGETSHLLRQSDTTGYGMMFKLNDSLTIYGFEFFATLLSPQDDTVQVAANLYTIDANGFPSVLLASDTVNIDTTGAVFPDIYAASRVAAFPAPVVLTDSFVLTIEALVDSTILVDFAASDPFVNTTGFLYGGTWGNLSDSIGGSNRPDFRPIVQYNLQAGFTVDGDTLGLGDTVYACTAQVLSFVNITDSIFLNSLFSKRWIFPGDLVRWEWGDGTPAGNNTSSATHSYALTGFYRVVMIDTLEGYTFPGLYMDSNEIIVQVDSVAPIPDFGYVNISDTTFSVAFSDSSIFGVTSVWFFGDGDSAIGTNPVHLYPDTGTYTVTQKVSNGCGMNSTVKMINVTCDTLPTAAFTYNYLGGDTFQFNNSSSNAKSYNWDFDDFSFSPLANPMHLYSPGTYTVILTATNDCGVDRDTQTVIHTSILEKEIIQNAIKIYPNPNDGSFEVMLFIPEEKAILVTVSNVVGKMIYKEQINSADNLRFDLSAYKKGLYFINIVSNKGSFSEKIIIE